MVTKWAAKVRRTRGPQKRPLKSWCWISGYILEHVGEKTYLRVCIGIGIEKLEVL